MRVALYARLSKSRDDSTSCDLQLAHARTLAERNRWAVVAEFRDDGVSGATPPEDRPSMSALLDRLADFDAVVVYRLDRVARSLIGFVDLLRRFEAAGVSIVSVTEPFDTTTPYGRAMVQILAVFAEMERALIRERVLTSKEHLASMGRHVYGRAPFGLRIVPAPDGVGKVLERDPEAVEIIREIIRRLCAGETATAIARDFNRRGVPAPRVHSAKSPNPKPAAWGFPGIAHIIRHPSILGWRTDSRGHVIRGDDGREVEFWPPVAPREDVEKARQALESRRGERTRPGATHPLYRVAFCGLCGRQMTMNRNHDKTGEAHLRCVGSARQPCSGVLIRYRRVWDYLEREFLETFGRLPAVERVWVPGTGEDVERELASVQAAIDAMRDDRAQGLYDDDLDAYRDRMRALLARRKVLRETPRTPGHWEAKPLGVTFGDLWKKLDEHGRGDLLRSAGVRVVVHKARYPRAPIEERVDIQFPTEDLLGVASD